MAVYSVMQIVMSDDQVRMVNQTFKRGDLYPEWYRKRLATSCNPTADAIYDAWPLYVETAHIEADDLEEVFDIGNIGPEYRVERRGTVQMHSISVGDVIVDTERKTAWFVDTFGFGALGNVLDEVA
mgnify:FL=1|jgi:hypothetical protein|tara:strand:+ start:134 stop:511 length:378 start_codon:yes stop_codon:yes gene_type:complete